MTTLDRSAGDPPETPDAAAVPDAEHVDGPANEWADDADEVDGTALLPGEHRGAFGEFAGESSAFIDRSFRERIVLVGVALPGMAEEEVAANLDELARLVDTAGADEVGRFVQRRRSPDPATYIGRGKVEDVRDLAVATDSDTVVFDDELAPAQQRNLQKALGRTAIDRTAVILDIFGQNASSLEGKAQVELALLKYQLPRLRGRSGTMSQQSNAIGMRGGPGETQLEIDRRRVVRRIHRLEGELREIARHRSTQRKARQRAGIRHVAIVGYTNAGKSTLLNQLTDAGVLAEDRLFATLDSTTRKLALPGGESVLLTDTVGFVRKLPHQLVEAFKSTLEVAAEADLLLLLVDASTVDPESQITAVRDVLGAIGAGDRPAVMVINKADQAPDRAARLVEDHPDAVVVSAREGHGVDDLLGTIANRLRSGRSTLSMLVPWDRGDVLAALHRHGEVLAQEPTDRGMLVRASVAPVALGRFSEFEVPE